ncbi:hypothetical protein TNIN_356601 [Trichonephila inaurata madagascariensis]|uniref:Uncharacterized protein n=1 Tax=Trichonephila inaurata madagascariensis TaxID=2747483 RepID=A0A8X6JI37_9ARAC|nr:hypothetical protein TNIN_356601 [Trichonephila inaurata madagascariensis]
MSGRGPLKLHPPSKWMKWTRHRRVDHARWTLGERNSWTCLEWHVSTKMCHFPSLECDGTVQKKREKCFLNMTKGMKTTIHDVFILYLLLKVGKYL